MKKKHNSWRSALSMLLAMLMLVGQFGGVFAAEAEEEKPLYVAIGESMTNGFGIPEYYGKANTENDYQSWWELVLDYSKQHLMFDEEAIENSANAYDKESGRNWGYGRNVTDAYPALVGEGLEELTGEDWEVRQMAISSMRPEDFHWILDEEYPIYDTVDDGGADHYSKQDYYVEAAFGRNAYSHVDENGDGKVDRETTKSEQLAIVKAARNELRDQYQKAFAEAEYVSLHLGTHSFTSTTAETIWGLVGLTNPGDVDAMLARDFNIDELLSSMKREDMRPVYDQIMKEVDDYLKANVTEPLYSNVVKPMTHVLSYATLSFLIHYDECLDHIRELNSDAQLIVISMPNVMNGMVLDMGGSKIDLGELYDIPLTFLNTYRAGDWDDQQFDYIYVDVENIDFGIDALARGVDKDGNRIPANAEGYEGANEVFRAAILEQLRDQSGGMIDYAMASVQEYTGLNFEDFVLEYIVADEERREAMRVDFVDKFVTNASGGQLSYPLLCSIYKGIAQSEDVPPVFDMLDTLYVNIKDIPVEALGEALGDLKDYAPAIKEGVPVLVENLLYSDTPLWMGIDICDRIYYESMVIARDSLSEDGCIDGEIFMQAIGGGMGSLLTTLLGELMGVDENGQPLELSEGSKTILYVTDRLLIQNGQGIHPSERGHQQVAEAVIAAVKENSTTKVQISSAIETYIEENREQLADEVYNWLLTNPEKVIAILNGAETSEEEQIMLGIIVYIYNNFGGQEYIDKHLDAMKADPAGTIDQLVDLVLTHGDNAYRLVKTYLIAAELTPEDYENAFEYLVEVLKEYGPGIAQGIYDWAESEGYIAEIEKAVEEFTGIVEEDVVAFVETVQPKIEKAIAELEKFIAEKEAQSAELKAKLETEIVPEIERLNAELKEKKAQYDVVMAHIDEYHPEEKEAVINALKAEIAELEAQIANDEAIKAQIEEAVNNISEEAEDVKAVAKEIEAKIAELGKEAEKLAVVSEELIKAVEKLAKVSVENIDEATVEEEISAIIADLQTAAEEMLRTLKDAWTFTELGTGIANAAIKLGESLQTKAEKYEEVIGPEVEAVVNELTKLVDGSTPEATVILEAMLGDVKELASISEELAKEIADVAEVTVKEAEKLVKVIAEEVEKSVKYLENAVKTAYLNAITGEYVYTKDAYYVNLGDSIGKGENNYAEKVAAELGLEEEYKDYSYENFRTEDFRYILDEDYEGDAYSKAVVGNNREALRKEITAELRKADFITVGTGNLTPFVMAQIAKSLEKNSEPYEMDWAKLVGEDHVQYVEMALAEVEKYINETELPEIPYANIIGNYINTDIREIVMTAAESYAYAYAGFAFNYTELANVIHEINPEAEVVLVGSYNALDGLEMDGTNFGEYVDYLVELMDMQFTAYGMLTDKTTFVEVNETKVEKPVASITDLVMSIIPQLDLGLPSFVTSIIQNMIGTDGAELNPSEEGHEYIKEQIFDAMSVTYGGGLGDVNLDGEVDAKDATQILRYVNAKTSVFTTYKGHKAELAKALADVDYYPGIEARDATQILRYCNAKTNTIEGRQ